MIALRSRPRLGRRAGARPPPASAAARRVIAARDPAPGPNGHVDNVDDGCVTATGRRRRRNRPGSCQEPSTGRPASPSAPVSIATTGSGPANDRANVSRCRPSCPLPPTEPPTLPGTMPPRPPVTTTTPRDPGLRPFRDARPDSGDGTTASSADRKSPQWAGRVRPRRCRDRRPVPRANPSGSPTRPPRILTPAP